MRKFLCLKYMLIATFAILVSGCSSTPPVAEKKINAQTNYDYEKMGAIGRTAQKNGVGIIWVHPPLKKKK